MREIQASRRSSSPPWAVHSDKLVLLALLAGDPDDHVEQGGRDAGEHLLEVLQQPADVLAVTDDLQQVLGTHEVEPVCSMCSVYNVYTVQCVHCTVYSVQNMYSVCSMYAVWPVCEVCEVCEVCVCSM